MGTPRRGTPNAGRSRRRSEGASASGHAKRTRPGSWPRQVRCRGLFVRRLESTGADTAALVSSEPAALAAGTRPGSTQWGPSRAPRTSISTLIGSARARLGLTNDARRIHRPGTRSGPGGGLPSWYLRWPSSSGRCGERGCHPSPRALGATVGVIIRGRSVAAVPKRATQKGAWLGGSSRSWKNRSRTPPRMPSRSA